MAVRFDASGDSLNRTTSLPTITSWTMMCWVYVVTIPVTPGVLSFGTANGSSFYAAGFQTSTGIKVWTYSPAGQGTGTTALAANTWGHLATTVAGTGAGQFLTYLNGVQEVSASGSASPTAAKMYLGNTDGGDWHDGRIAAVKVYSAVLTADEIKNEMRSYMPVRTANLTIWSPLFTSTELQNYAVGGGGGWTVGGTLATEDGPPIPRSLRPGFQAWRAAVAGGLPLWAYGGGARVHPLLAQ